MAFTQHNRRFRIKTALGETDLILYRLEGSEQLSRLFEFNVELHSDNLTIRHEDLLGEQVTVTIELDNGSHRYISGVISRFELSAMSERHVAYYATIHPWLWLLTRTADCRIFQEKTVPEIIKEVFTDSGFSDFEQHLSGHYRTWEYCVQYRESDFNFVSRLMEEEGIYYFFKHEDGRHVLVMADAPNAHEPVVGYESILYYPPDHHNHRNEEHFFHWTATKQIQPGTYAMRDFDFKAPKKDLTALSQVQRAHTASEFEFYDYPGMYSEPADGESYAKYRIQELQAQHETVHAVGNVAALLPGAVFTLENFPRDDQNRKYLLVSAHYTLSSPSLEGGGSEQEAYQVAVQAIDAEQPFRAPRTTPKPVVHGVQTAIVVGPAGEEIYTDKYGRVKCQFHWDRYGRANENSSCWIRVSHLWAGKNWGGVFTPRIGHEVIVDFLEGDPDRPIVVGRVYNNDNMPPYTLPDNKTQSGVKTRSSKGGDTATFNEIRFEDKLGSEELYIHAEKDQTNIVENDRNENVGHDHTESIGNDRTKTVGHDQSETVGNDKSITVVNNHTESIGVDKTLSVGANHSETIGSNMTITVGANLTETIAINYAETVGAAKESTIGGLLLETIGLTKAVNVGTNSSEDVGGSKSVSVGKNLVVDVADQITIKTGKASIVMKKDGTITISGKDITIDAKGAINVKASKDVSVKSSKNVALKGKKILEN